MEVVEKIVSNFPHITSDWLIFGTTHQKDKTTKRSQFQKTPVNTRSGKDGKSLPESLKDGENKEQSIDTGARKQPKSIIICYPNGSFDYLSK